MHRLRAPAALLVLLLVAGAVPGPGTAAVSPAAAATSSTGPGSAATATSPVLIGTFQPDASGGACAAWDAGCRQTALQPTATRGVWALTLTIPAGDWHWRVAPDGDAADSIGVGTRVDGADVRLQLSGPQAVTFAFDATWLAATSSTADTFAWAWQQTGPCPSVPAAPPPVDPAAVLFDPDGDGISTAVVSLVPGACLQLVEGSAGHVIEVPTPGLTGAVVVAFDASGGAATAYPAGPPAADGRLDPLGFGHDSRDPAYRSPQGASPAGAPIRLRFRTFHADATGVTLHVTDDVTHRSSDTPMTLAAVGVPCAEQPQDALGTCDWWEATITPAVPTTLHYRFIVADGAARDYYADDALLDGGRGAVTRIGVDTGWVVTVYVPGTQAVPWLDGAVVYQIFPDRFRNGDPANDVNTNAARYAWPPDESDRPVRRPWGARPNPATASNEWFGGDLAGITRNLDYLEKLGVSVLYLNPIFSAASNHAYDTRDYRLIDPRFGDAASWAALVSAAEARGMHIVLDGVFNHVSSDSPYFDRYGHFATLGACESTASPYRSWFTFTPLVGGPCAGPDGPHTMDYARWSNVASLPVLNKRDAGVRALLYEGPNAIARTWLRAGAAGWRLDAMTDPSFGSDFWPAFRTAVKGTNPDAVIVAEAWQRDQVLPEIRGDTADTTMNYRFQNAVTGYLGTIGQEGFPDAGATAQPPSLFAGKILGMYEDMPAFAARTAWNLLDSHDTERILWSLAPGDATSKEAPANLAVAKARLRLATLLQFTLPGAPTIYYGDELGLTGADDPDDRRTFPVLGVGGALPASADASLHAWYQTVAALRADLPVLRDGALQFLVTNDRDRTLAYSRYDDGTGLAIVALNPDPDKAARIRIPLADALGTGTGVPDGVRFTDRTRGTTLTSVDGALTVDLPPLAGAVLVPSEPIPAPLAAPAGLVAAPQAASGAAVSVRWGPVPAADGGYVVYRSPLPGGPATLAGRTSGLTATVLAADRPPTPGTWWYTVRAVDAKGWVGAPSVLASVVVRAPLPASSPAAGSGGPGSAAPGSVPGATPGGTDPLPLVLAALGLVALLLAAFTARRRHRRRTG
jgi:glycosidase